MRTGQAVCLDPDRADLRRLTAIQTLTLIEDRTAHRLFLYIVVVAVDHLYLLVGQLLFRELRLILLDDLLERLGALLLAGA